MKNCRMKFYGVVCARLIIDDWKHVPAHTLRRWHVMTVSAMCTIHRPRRSTTPVVGRKFSFFSLFVFVHFVKCCSKNLVSTNRPNVLGSGNRCSVKELANIKFCWFFFIFVFKWLWPAGRRQINFRNLNGFFSLVFLFGLNVYLHNFDAIELLKHARRTAVGSWLVFASCCWCVFFFVIRQ